jgi:hypothetical protein
VPFGLPSQVKKVVKRGNQLPSCCRSYRGEVFQLSVHVVDATIQLLDLCSYTPRYFFPALLCFGVLHLLSGSGPKAGGFLSPLAFPDPSCCEPGLHEQHPSRR